MTKHFPPGIKRITVLEIMYEFTFILLQWTPMSRQFCNSFLDMSLFDSLDLWGWVEGSLWVKGNGVGIALKWGELNHVAARCKLQLVSCILGSGAAFSHCSM